MIKLFDISTSSDDLVISYSTCSQYFLATTATLPLKIIATSGSLSTSPSSILTMPAVPFVTRAIALSFDKMIDYQIDKVTRDKVPIFAIISLVSCTIHVGPLPDVGASFLQFEVASGGVLAAFASVDLLIVTIEQ